MFKCVLQDSPSEPEDNTLRVSQLRKQRYVSTQSPTPSLPPAIPLDPSHGPPKPPRTSFGDSRKLGDGGAASDGEIDRNGVSGAGSGRKQAKRRESHSRRHTLQNGIDYGLVSKLICPLHFV